jgi:hypothetical protein
MHFGGALTPTYKLHFSIFIWINVDPDQDLA